MTRPRFSTRTGWDLTENRLSARVTSARAEGRTLLDLTESNPTRIALQAGAEALVARLGHARGASYVPVAAGYPDARAAVALYYEERGLDVAASHVTLSASTSEAYGWLFKLLADPGDNVLVPTPSYPLFSFLADLADVELLPYPLVREEGFRVDVDAVERAMDERTRAILLVHPNNPTGSFVRRDDADRLARLADTRGLALVVDEVFGDYALGELAADKRPSFVGESRALTFVLSGLSKVMALPQLKLGWIVTSGPPELVAEAERRLEVIADTYLSVATPVQLALPELLASRGVVQAALRERVQANLAALDRALALAAPTPVRRLPIEGGWSVVVEVPRTQSEDAWVERLLSDDGVLVHPGYFFDLDREGYVVVSLLPEPDTFAEAIGRLVSRTSRAD
jgi:aspartate/methionine/tyrosine aminotransferase